MAIARHGGTVLPQNARFPSMPSAALAAVPEAIMALADGLATALVQRIRAMRHPQHSFASDNQGVDRPDAIGSYRATGRAG
jgi:hypothetical protein